MKREALQKQIDRLHVLNEKRLSSILTAEEEKEYFFLHRGNLTEETKEEIIENYGLSKLMDEVKEDERLSVEDAKKNV